MLRMEPGEAVNKLRLTLKVLQSFKAYYSSYRAASGVECSGNPWRFLNAAIFGRLDRCGRPALERAVSCPDRAFRRGAALPATAALMLRPWHRTPHCAAPANLTLAPDHRHACPQVHGALL
jgi:hypothetical protein